MHTACSARRVCSVPASAVEYTATASTPSSCKARMTRTAISPRFATRTRENIGGPLDGRRNEHRLDLEQKLPELDRLGVLDVNRADHSRDLGLQLVEQLHRLEQAEGLTRDDVVPHVDERRRSGARRAVEDADHRRLHPDYPIRRRRFQRD